MISSTNESCHDTLEITKHKWNKSLFIQQTLVTLHVHGTSRNKSSVSIAWRVRFYLNIMTRQSQQPYWWHDHTTGALPAESWQPQLYPTIMTDVNVFFCICVLLGLASRFLKSEVIKAFQTFKIFKSDLCDFKELFINLFLLDSK